jgi:hypothetical protein
MTVIRMYVALSDVDFRVARLDGVNDRRYEANPTKGRGIFALRVDNCERIWQTPSARLRRRRSRPTAGLSRGAGRYTIYSFIHPAGPETRIATCSPDALRDPDNFFFQLVPQPVPLRADRSRGPRPKELKRSFTDSLNRLAVTATGR